MCGIFGFVLKEGFDLTPAIDILRKLEVFTYPGRQSPVGGHGAGISYIEPNGKVFLKKVGKTNGSPVSDLMKLLDLRRVKPNVFLEHVRRASTQFNYTIQHRICAQPYSATCLEGIQVISTHNGFLSNYRELRDGLKADHRYESAAVELIDSEVFPHFYEELVRNEGAAKAIERLFCMTQGSATLALLSLKPDEKALSILQKGRTVGLTLWTNPEGEVLYCSRWEPVEEVLGDFLKEKSFQRRVFFEYAEPAAAYFTFKPPFL
jgi:glucosamine 6-phosphate synthetase-like amidotransferase/phosphosugar isomerase protein